MKEIILILFLVLNGVPAFAIPGRLQGFSYATDPETGVIAIKPETEDFNAPPVSYDIDPIPPHYLNEDGSDARTGAPQNGDKYQLSPVFSTQQLYDMRNDYETGAIEDENYSEEEIFEE